MARANKVSGDTPSTRKAPAGSEKTKPTRATAAGGRRGGKKGGDAAPSYSKTTIALVYDFDGTLSPKPMQEYGFLPKIGEAPEAFWAEVNAKAKADGADGMIVYMLLMYRKARQKGIEINREELVALGADVELFDGVEAWFDEIDAYVDTIAGSAFSVRHYLISSGLTEIVEGTSIYPRFANVFASEYFFEPYETPFPKRVVTDTNKTQYLFRINKGIEDLGISINEHMPESERPVPFANMIYFGDGDTDVPSMAVTRQNGGAAVAVFPPDGSDAKCRTLYEASRVDFFAAADYRAGSDLFRRTCLLLDRIVADIRVKQERHTLEQS